ncbi:unnamed protein product [Nesidiocoris tenuis]|uniref:Uncharacterized protein n=1 Tax=Nesidiocoris tenuis TaxID=355587 RepID=A0A6H5HIE5_9HEMI|nr:unnamed protein product [Nesidiocoris tenuis]
MIKRPRHRRQAQGSFLNVFVYFSDHHLAVSDKRGSPHHRIRLPVHTNDKRNHERQFKRKNNCDGRNACLRFNKRDEPTGIVGACIVLQHTIFTKILFNVAAFHRIFMAVVFGRLVNLDDILHFVGKALPSEAGTGSKKTVPTPKFTNGQNTNSHEPMSLGKGQISPLK